MSVSAQAHVPPLGVPLVRSVLHDALDPLAAADDRNGGAPVAALSYLVQCGAHGAVLPSAMGGLELGWSAGAAGWLSEWLRAIGSTHLSLARLYEGHVNAFQLIWTYGHAAQRSALCQYVSAGGWLGVWNAPHASGPLRLADARNGCYVLEGYKAYASGAGIIQRPLVTAQHEQLGYVMVWPSVAYETGAPEEWDMHGMRASVTLPVRYQHAQVDRDEIIGAHDDYHREPIFTTGAWRFLAAQLGAAERLSEWMVAGLLQAKRADDPHQRARIAEVALALESASLWVDRARLAAAGICSAEANTHTVRMARLAVEQQLLALVQLVQRSIGLASFRRDNPIERITRDLLTYLRQPVPDLVRDKVAAHVLAGIAGESA